VENDVTVFKEKFEGYEYKREVESETYSVDEPFSLFVLLLLDFKSIKINCS
jgi:hypothetical protein